MGVKKGGIVIVNTEKKPDFRIPDGVKLITIDATSIALKAIGLPITNTSLMGAFAAATGEIQFSALEKALMHRFPKELAVRNIEAARVAYDSVKGAAS
jgi:pyruvate ferredoxin oxidoreductase gamma subunit